VPEGDGEPGRGEEREVRRSEGVPEEIQRDGSEESDTEGEGDDSEETGDANGDTCENAVHY